MWKDIYHKYFKQIVSVNNIACKYFRKQTVSIAQTYASYYLYCGITGCDIDMEKKCYVLFVEVNREGAHYSLSEEQAALVSIVLADVDV